jgi:hypothetical protein
MTTGVKDTGDKLSPVVLSFDDLHGSPYLRFVDTGRKFIASVNNADGWSTMTDNICFPTPEIEQLVK